MRDWLKRFWKKHICDDFPYADQCFDCNRMNCEECRVKQKAT